jgi:hypothetical protein
MLEVEITIYLILNVADGGKSAHRAGCIKRCQVLVKVNIMSSDLIGGYLKLDLNQPIKWADFRLDALLADTMLTKLYTTGP